MKKLLAFVFAWGIIFSTVSVMAEREYVEGVCSDSTLKVTYSEGDVATVSFYDEGKLCGIKTARLRDGVYTFNLAEGDKDRDMRISYYGEKAYPVKTVTPTLEPTPTPAPQKTPYPEAYEKPIDAINAPAVVSEVAEVAVDGELFYELKVWYQGRELTTNVREKVVIKTAPSDTAYLIDKTVNYLQAGDIVHLTSDLQGRVKSVEFIYRPSFEDYFTDNLLTAGMIGTDNFSEYHFGVAVETYKTSMEMAGSDGRITDLDVSPDAFVYTVTKTRKGANVTLDGTGARLVPTAFIPDINITDNIIDWNGITENPYVLARESRGVVTDIIVFN